MVSYVGGPTSQNQVKRYWSHELWLKKWNNKALNTKHLIDIITLDLRQLRYIIKPHQIFYNNNKQITPNKATQSEARFIENKDTKSWK